MIKNEEKNIVFIDTSKECIDMMKKISKNALKEAGKIVTEKVGEKLPVKRGYFKKAIKAWAKIDFKTGSPYLEVGYLNRSNMKKKYGIKYYVNASWFEFGIKPHKIETKELKNNSKYRTYKLHDYRIEYGYSVNHPGFSSKNYLRNTVYENLDEINSSIQNGLKKLEDYTLTQGMNIDLGGDEMVE